MFDSNFSYKIILNNETDLPYADHDQTTKLLQMGLEELRSDCGKARVECAPRICVGNNIFTLCYSGWSSL